MNELSREPAKLRLLVDEAKVVEAVVAGLDSVSIRETIRVRASTLTPVQEKNLWFRPSSRWGINE